MFLLILQNVSFLKTPSPQSVCSRLYLKFFIVTYGVFILININSGLASNVWHYVKKGVLCEISRLCQDASLTHVSGCLL